MGMPKQSGKGVDSRILLQPQCLHVPQVVVELVVLNKAQGLALTFQGEVGFDQPRLLEGGGGFFLAADLVVGRGQFAEGIVAESPWDSRRLQSLRGWSHERVYEIFPGSPRAGSADGFEHQAGYELQWATIGSIAAEIGCTAETFRKLLCQAERAPGRRAGLTSDERERLVSSGQHRGHGARHCALPLLRIETDNRRITPL